jgi:WD40 repeat protein
VKSAATLARWIGVCALAACNGAPPPAPHVASDTALSLDLPTPDVTWTSDGRFALFTKYAQAERLRTGVVTVADPAARTSWSVADTTDHLVMPDRMHLAAVTGGALRFYELASGAATDSAWPCGADLTAAPDGHFLCARETPTAYQLYSIDPGSGRVVAYEPLPHDADSRLDLRFDRAHHVLAVVMTITETPTHAHVFGLDAPEPLVVPAVDTEHFRFVGNGFLYMERVDHVWHLVFVPLSPLGPRLGFHHDAHCGTTDMRLFTQPYRCDATHIMLATDREFCVWDLATGTVVSHFGPIHDEAHCHRDYAWARDREPTRAYTVWSTKTGERATPAHFEPGDPFGPDSAAFGEAPELDELPSPDEVEHLPPRPPAPFPRDAVRSPDGAQWAAIVDGTPTIWSATGDVVWRGPQQSAVVHAAFAPDGTLVVVGADDTIWHLDLAHGTLGIGSLPACGPPDALFTVGPDGRGVAVCRQKATIVAEDRAAPLLELHSEVFGWAATTDAILVGAGGRLQEITIPGGAPRWDVEDPAEPNSLAPDGKSFAALATDHKVAIHDAPHSSTPLAPTGGMVLATAFSPDGNTLAVLDDAKHIALYDVATATQTAHLAADTRAFAWSPDGTRIAYLRRDALVVWSAGTESAHPLALAGRVDELHWSSERIAAVVDGQVLVWDAAHLDHPPVTLGFTGRGALELHADGSARLYGNRTDARRLARCSVHGIASTSLDRCEERFAR